MIATSAYRAVSTLERQCAAALVRIRHRLEDLHARRCLLVERQASVREAMLGSGCWSSFACQMLSAYTAWGASRVRDISTTRLELWSAAERTAAERRRWARLRVGLERRSRAAVDPARPGWERSWAG